MPGGSALSERTATTAVADGDRFQRVYDKGTLVLQFFTFCGDILTFRVFFVTLHNRVK